MSKAMTGRERFFEENDVIVTKTDCSGRITYANDIFLNISDLNESAAIGAPHNIIRHPDMPACIFRLLWTTVQAGREIFAYVLNRAAKGDHYWVFAHVTPTLAADGQIAGFHSNRRRPDRRIIEETMVPLYRTLLNTECQAVSRAKGIEAAQALLEQRLQAQGMDYDRFIFSLQA